VEALARLLSVEQSARPTAIVGYNDELAILMLDVFREKSISVPEDLSLVGFDDSYMGRLTEVKLTTIQHPQSKMGETAAKMIVDMIKEKNSQQRKSPEKVESVVFEPNLILRSSTASLQLKKQVTL
jgi:GntR family transcriptional regulator of arabinose operon